MGQSQPKYRITSTKKKDTTQAWESWEGFSAVVTLGKKVVFPDAEYEYIRFRNAIRIVEGPHKGFYELELAPDRPERLSKVMRA